MGKEQSNRIQTSILAASEKRVLVWLAHRQPRWMTSDKLSFIGVLGAFICGVGYALSSFDIHFLWLSSFGLLVNWYGDSLDGTLARVRNTQRPKYGFFIDHTIDALTIALMCFGAGLSPLLKMEVALLVLAAYLTMSVYTYICTLVKEEFRLTYGKLGPTEFRVIVIIINTLFIYTPWRNITVGVGGQTVALFDIVGVAIAAIIYLLAFVQWLKDRKELALKDPLKHYDADSKKTTIDLKKRA